MIHTLICRPKWIKCDGEVYRQSSFLLIQWQDDDLPQFAKIEDILIVLNFPFFIVCTFITQRICHHYHSYAVKKGRQMLVVTLAEIGDSHPVYCHHVHGDSTLYVTMRSYVENAKSSPS